MTTALYDGGAVHFAARGQGPRPFLAAWASKLSPRKFFRARRWRAELNAMTDVELKDIGLSRCQIGAVVDGTFSR